MRLIKLAGIFILTAFFAVSAGCGTTYNADKIPITTSSEKAKEEFLKGRGLAEKLRGTDSRQYFTNAINEDPDFAVAYLNRSFVQVGAKEFFDDLNKAVSLADKVSEGERLQILAAQAGTNGDPVKQKEYLEKLVSLYPNDERAVNALGNFYFGQQKDREAVEQYEKVIKINPEFSQVYNQMGYAYRNLNEYDKAEKAFKKYTELIPDDPNPYDSYAELLLKTGRYDESISYYKKALEQDEHFLASHIGIAADYMYKGDYAKAHEQLRKMNEAARNDGERRNVMFIEACVYIDEGKPDMAIKEFEKQIALDEKNSDYANISADILTIAIVLYEQGKYDEALAKYREAANVFDKSAAKQEAKDNNRLVLGFNEGKIALDRGDIKTAKAKADEFMKAVTAKNNLNQIKLAHEFTAMIALAENNADKALEELAETSPLNPYNHYRMAAAYQMKGDMNKAKEYCGKAINFNGLPNMNNSYARVRAKEMMMAL